MAWWPLIVFLCPLGPKQQCNSRRVDQITQLLSSRSLEGEGSKDSLLASPAKDHESSDHQPTDENVRSLELERQEIIGVL
ncbi:hypothetical protein KY285_000116 [Solanum tuberosum]|nr:hypothetical protein KY284_000127 [Solanum tuberosum]KAH0764245.1 hypothetical protein KY285_000116 [Solanum tuberosum]